MSSVSGPIGGRLLYLCTKHGTTHSLLKCRMATYHNKKTRTVRISIIANRHPEESVLAFIDIVEFDCLPWLNK